MDENTDRSRVVVQFPAPREQVIAKLNDAWQEVRTCCGAELVGAAFASELASLSEASGVTHKEAMKATRARKKRATEALRIALENALSAGVSVSSDAMMRMEPSILD